MAELTSCYVTVWACMSYLRLVNTTDRVCSHPDLDNLVGARGEQVSSGGLIVHVNNAVLAVVEGGRGRSTAMTQRKHRSLYCVSAPASWQHKGSVWDKNRGWLLLTPRQWWTRGSCHTHAPRTRSPWGGWWSVWTNICRTPPGHTSYSGAEEHRRASTCQLWSATVSFLTRSSRVRKCQRWAEVPSQSRLWIQAPS